MTEARTSTPPPAVRPGEEDQRLYLRGLTWDDFEAFLRIRGEASAPRIHFLDGVLELMGPGWNHESIKKAIARLLEAWTDERGPDLEGVGGWLLKRSEKEAGAEPDECYIVGAVSAGERERPDLAIEVIWTHGGLDRLEIYRRLEVQEVWLWDGGRLTVHQLRADGSGYDASSASALLPDVDIELIGALASVHGAQAPHVKKLRAWLRGEGPRPEA